MIIRKNIIYWNKNIINYLSIIVRILQIFVGVQHYPYINILEHQLAFLNSVPFILQIIKVGFQINY
ncbi:hypothetical protein GLOIN_2v1542598 [Rhizophagus irregularis DAOM 181602=DAOM 197198]|uniref:Uncharacterized protein n=1 Tax=Rhizophagus irregularis (strain DAOM 181602 / DAOM 197198 / MUCL 43194) TaxID=747089 RepID=A0A2P4QJV4_RHIID|nr:hypothetical protein GLOIN_2v1542598 [Rhizophagus irregularis DAOM 181602=DAOM 197198]POG77911.1 hypothetical protein GLOIN_2v1542598 [Rhizophagus irregularis DAOM 181602=DAOM 197198]|eukprot:XP_025184777.1 hypothetical protein GLOIN_2v1542598 [Rhizophagus irregularis DAOM 181602=DAOM 197198]